MSAPKLLPEAFGEVLQAAEAEGWVDFDYHPWTTYAADATEQDAIDFLIDKGYARLVCEACGNTSYWRAIAAENSLHYLDRDGSGEWEEESSAEQVDYECGECGEAANENAEILLNQID
jgi:predicted RNA-binding Zn-ribbon protein involved in translation (DUF1610 family)